MKNDASGRAWQTRLSLLLPLANLIWIVYFLSNYSNVWVQPEANSWRGYLSRNYTLSEGIVGAFNWHAFEGEPRLTRPLSSLMETLDNSIRKRLWRTFTPHPALSVTYLFTLVLTPLLLYGILRALGVREFIAVCGAALYLSNPGVLSLVAIGFRPGKAMACAATALVLWWASRLQKLTISRVAPLYLCLFFSLFWDEIAIIALPALLLLFPRVVFSSKVSAATFFSIPIGYAMTVRWLLPAIHAAAGFPVPPGATYQPLERFTNWVTFASNEGAGAEFNRHVAANARIAIMDSLGLINPALPGTAAYDVVFGAIVCCLAVFAFMIGRRVFRAQNTQQHTICNRSVVIRSVAFLVACLIFHTMLLAVVDQGTWGLYWYGAFIVLGFVIATATLLQYLRVHSLLVAAFVIMVSAGSFYTFQATNRAYKIFHYYPYRAGLLNRVFENQVNRFRLPGPSVSGSELRRYTQKLVRERDIAPVIGAPKELLYVVYELGLNSNSEGCWAYDSTFNLSRISGRYSLDCQEPIANSEEIAPFLGAWLMPAPVVVEPNSLFVAMEDGIPHVARIADNRIEVNGREQTGRLSEDGQSLVWTNGTIWQRRSGDKASLEGHWWFKLSCVIRKAGASDVLINGDSEAGIIQYGALLVPQRFAAAVMSTDHRKVFWTDNVVWTRPGDH